MVCLTCPDQMQAIGRQQNHPVAHMLLITEQDAHRSLIVWPLLHPTRCKRNIKRHLTGLRMPHTGSKSLTPRPRPRHPPGSARRA